jgi:predicted molibdopterin-dependent oxidoreductase YjgC
MQAVRGGARLIVADSRRIRLARLADLHLRHRNGTDVALLNGMMHVILRENLENPTFIEKRTENIEDLRRTAAEFTPARVAAITGLNEEQITGAARLFAGAKRAMIIFSMGITQHTHGVDNVRACAALAMLTGQVGRPGTGVNPLRGQNNVQGACDMGALPDVFSGYQKVADPQVRDRFAHAWGVDLPERPGLTLTGAMNAAADGAINGLFVMGENPMVSDPDQAHAAKALGKLDLLVAQDIFPTATTRLADIVLPAACFAEKDGTFTSTERRIQRVRRAVAPPGESLADWEILCALAARAGYDGMRYDSPAEIMEEIAALTPSYGGIRYHRLDRFGLQWPCPAEDHPGTAVLHADTFPRGLGLFCPADYRPPAEEPDAEHPFILTTGRNGFHYHTGTMTRRTHLLDREEPFSYVEIHPGDAALLNIRNRQEVTVATRRGRVRALARLTEAIIPGVLFMPFHFEEGAANALTNNALDPESEIPEYKVCAARISVEP